MAEEIVHEVLWSDSAKNSFSKIVNYLNRVWTEKEVAKFIGRTDEMISTLKCYPEMGRLSSKKKYVRISLLDKHNQLIYHYKRPPEKLKFYYFGT